MALDDDLSLASRGAALLPTLPAPAGDATNELLARIASRLGTATPSPIFAALAVWPDFLADAWERYEPLIDTPRYRQAIERIQPSPALLDGLPDVAGEDAALREYIAMQRSLLPDLFLLASTWLRSAKGEASAAPVGEPDAPRTVRVASLTPGDPDPRVTELLEDLRRAHDQPRVLSVYRAIASRPDFFVAAAPQLLARIRSDDYAAAVDALHAQAADADFGMPAVAAPEHGPLEILALFRTRMIPALILDLALLEGMLPPDTRSTTA